MRILLLNQTFHPDVTATAQYLTELARGLVEHGHQVTVITSRRAYDEPEKRFAARETWNGIEIHRVAATGFGKGAKWKRVADFVSFIISCAFKLLLTPRPDVLVALTSPPLISFVGAWAARLRGYRFIYWVMDLNPDEAIAAGWLREGSFVAGMLQRMSQFSLREAEAVVVLDRFMRDRVLAKGIAPEKIHVIAPWSHDDAVRSDPAGRERFRMAHGLTGKFVVMYSGNHSPCHPLDTLLEAARILEKGSTGDSPDTLGNLPSDDPSPPRPGRGKKGEVSKGALNSQHSTLNTSAPIAFCFVGGGSEFTKVKRFAAEHVLTNITCLPYQPLSELSGSLSAADLHVVVMGNPFVGTIHPCKVYNILAIGAPVLYIGPQPSHVMDLFQELQRPALCSSAEHGDVPAVVERIRIAAQRATERDPEAFKHLSPSFSKRTLLPKLLRLFDPPGAR